MAYTNTRDTLGDQTTLDLLIANELEELKEEGADTLAQYALYSNKGLKSVEMPGLTSKTIGSSAFAGCTALVSAAFPNLKSLGQYMFQGCTALKDVSAPELTSGSTAAFSGCTALESVAFPKMTTLGQSMFYGCSKLTSVSFSTGMTTIAAAAFAACTNLAEVDMPLVKTIGSSAFSGCTKLSAVSFPAATSIYRSAFWSAPIGRLALPAATTLQSNITNAAAEVDFSAKPSIVASAFTGDTNMTALILRNEAQLTLANVNALSNTPIAVGYGYIYVPSTLVDTYKSASNWVTYADQIVSLDEYPKPIGTITDSWAEIMEAEADGTYATKYSVGDTKTVKVGGISVLMQIVAMNADALADDSGNAKITWMCFGLPWTHVMNATNTNANGWTASNMRSWLIDDVLSVVEDDVKSNIKTVHKTFYDYTSKTTKTSDDDIWIPSAREIFGGTSYESSGCDYTAFFADANGRIKKTGAFATGSAANWWLRSATSFGGTYFWNVSSNGISDYYSAGTAYGVAFGFCT